jgi:hypothetical protein
MTEHNYQSEKDFGKGGNWDSKITVKNRQPAIIFLIIFGVFCISLGIYQFESRVNKPFLIAKDSSNASQAELEAQNTALLQSRDTDGDGLSDYDEIKIYHTSPYLEDTDSDGINDSAEIAQGSNPLCAGDTCSTAAENFATASSTASSTETAAVLPTTNSTNSASSSLSAEETEVLNGVISGQADPQTLRALLLANGFKEEDLKLISDDDLQTAYLEVAKEQLAQQQETINNQ